MVQESDWKKYQSLIPTLRERFLAEKNSLIVKNITEPERTETERFWDTLKRMKKISKDLSDCLDEHSRSKMFMSMLNMLHVGMLTQEDLIVFSDELRDKLKQFVSRS